MRILVTGASGFIGRHVIDTLKKFSHEIVATGLEREFVTCIDKYERLTYIAADLNSLVENPFDYFGKPDTLIHLSWEGLPRYDELFHFEKNLMANYGFVKALVAAGTKNVTVVGTCLEYGLRDGCLSEDLVPNPSTPYGIAKDCLRRFLGALKQTMPFSFKWIRLFYLYGSGQNKDAILEQLKTAISRGEKMFNMSPGEQLRDYLPVERVADCIVRIALQEKVQGIVNCCSGKPISIRRLVEDYIRVCGAEIALNLGYYDYPEYEPRAFWGDTRKLSAILEE